jgi:hypothetical protein
MGLLPSEVKALQYKDFWLMFTGYERRLEKEWDRTRNVIWATIKYAGMGAPDVPPVSELFPLSMDREFEKRLITNLAMAKELYKTFV